MGTKKSHKAVPLNPIVIYVETLYPMNVQGGLVRTFSPNQRVQGLNPRGNGLESTNFHLAFYVRYM